MSVHANDLGVEESVVDRPSLTCELSMALFFKNNKLTDSACKEKRDTRFRDPEEEADKRCGTGQV